MSNISTTSDSNRASAVVGIDVLGMAPYIQVDEDRLIVLVSLENRKMLNYAPNSRYFHSGSTIKSISTIMVG